MKKYILISLLLFSSSFLHSAVIDLGSEYRLRSVTLANPTYTSETPVGTGKTIDQHYFSHRARVYFKGKFDPNIEIGATLQALSVAGSTAPFINRYPKEDFTPFIENATIQANEIYDFPISVTLGRQPYQWGTGLLIADDGLGFDSVRLDAGPFWNISTHFLTAKVKEHLTSGDQDLHLAGLSYNWGLNKIRAGYIIEIDQTGSSYFNLSSTTPVSTEKISREFIDFQLEGRLEKGAYYNAEYVIQRGYSRVPGTETKLSGSALTFEGGFDFIHPRYKRMILAFVFMQGSGDNSSTTNEDEKFNPSFGHKYDGLERSGRGELFAGNPYTFFNEDKVIIPITVGSSVIATRPYTATYSGIRTFGFKGSVQPWDFFTAGLEYYLYTAMEKSDLGVGAPSLIQKSIGRELVITGQINYFKYINFSIRWGKFFPSSILNDVGSSRLMLEAQGRF